MTNQPMAEVHELVELLNSWRVPNETRQPVDHLEEWAASEEWEAHFTVIPRPSSSAAVMEARDGLREAASGGTTAVLDRLLGELPPRLSIADDRSLRSAPAVNDAAAIVVWLSFRLAATGRLHRLRVCPDCGWAFFDTTRNAQRVWCAMTTADGGRGCGSIAKTRAYRARRRAHRHTAAPTG